MEGRDRGCGQRHARVGGDDLRVVPLGDGARVDPGEERRGEDELADAREVVGRDDRAAHHRDVDGRTGSTTRVGVGLVLVLEGRVRAGERGLLVDEVLDARARAVGLVVDRRAGARGLVGVDPRGHGVLLGGGARRLDRAGGAVGVVGARRRAPAAVVRAASSERKRACERDRCNGGDALDGHPGPPRCRLVLTPRG